MVESNTAPPGFIVTHIAAAVGVIFHFDLVLMHVPVAIAAVFADIPEIPLIIFFVTGNTGCGNMGSFQCKGIGLMVLNAH